MCLNNPVWYLFVLASAESELLLPSCCCRHASLMASSPGKSKSGLATYCATETAETVASGATTARIRVTRDYSFASSFNASVPVET